MGKFRLVKSFFSVILLNLRLKIFCLFLIHCDPLPAFRRATHPGYIAIRPLVFLSSTNSSPVVRAGGGGRQNFYKTRALISFLGTTGSYLFISWSQEAGLPTIALFTLQMVYSGCVSSLPTFITGIVNSQWALVSVCWLVGPSVGFFVGPSSVCHKYSKRAGSYTSMLLLLKSIHHQKRNEMFIENQHTPYLPTDKCNAFSTQIMHCRLYSHFLKKVSINEKQGHTQPFLEERRSQPSCQIRLWDPLWNQL